MTAITVYKCDHLGTVVWQYEGVVLERGENWLCLQARYNGPESDWGFVQFIPGDLFTEWFYADRWYNIFRIEDDTRLKGWYCNITRPAQLSDISVSAEDLALDVFVTPDGEFRLLDEDEFAELDLNDTDQEAALAAVETLRTLVSEHQPPFDAITTH
jgi:protein associated with RNAse G/E